MKWMLYRLDQDLRAFIFKYVEVVEKSFKSILQEKYGPQVLDPNLQLRFSHICCSITNKCSDKIKNELIEKLNQKNLPFIKISETNVKKMQKEMYIFQGDCFYPNKDKFNQIVNFRNQIQHFDFILPTIIKDEDKIFKYFFKQFNIHYRHSLALNFLAALLKRMTTDFDNFSKQILNDLTILFPLTENITQNTEWQKLTKARYHDCVTYGNYELKYKDYYEEANKLWNDPAKGKSLYNQKKIYQLRYQNILMII